MPITQSPAVPNRTNPPATFSAQMQAFLAWMSQYAIDLNAVGTAYNLATNATSATSNNLTTGAKTFTVAAGLGFIAGMPLRFANTASPLNYAQATVTSYSGTSLQVNFDTITGSGSAITTWSISLSAGSLGAGLASNTFGGVQNFFQGADIVAAATVNLTTATGNVNRITGNTGIGAFTLSDGFTRYGVITGTPLLTYNATTNNMNTSGANYQCVGGERYEAYSMSGVVYIQISRPDGIPINTTSKIQSVTATQSAGALTLTTNPTTLDYRSTTLTSGVPVTRTLTSASSLVVPSGATLGIPTTSTGRLVKGLLDNAGTLEEFVINLAGGGNLDETVLISTTAISAGSTSANVFYSTFARTGVAFRITGVVDVVNTAGAYSSPALVQGAGGQALQHVNALISGTAVATTSGTFVDFTAIPNWAKRITVVFSGVLNSTAEFLVQVGSGSLTTTGYVSYATRFGTGGTGAGTTVASGFHVDNISAANSATGSMVITTINGLQYVESHTAFTAAINSVLTGAGNITLTGPIDRVRVTTTGGGTFSAGIVNVLWE